MVNPRGLSVGSAEREPAMIGVVVWSNRIREQAVIWCDDHAALAYLVGRDHFEAEIGWPEPGDMVELCDEVQGELRLAREVRPLSDAVLPRLQDLLAQEGQARRSPRLKIVDPQPAPCAEIIPLPRRAAC